jgi:hypothetical protein
MSIKLTWNNPNTTFDEVRIYRSLTPFNFSALPVPIATGLTGNTFDDITAERNVTYYYLLSVIKGTDELLSPVKILANMPYTGPGPQRLLRGDWKRGYFGELPNTELFTASELLSLAGLSGNVSTNGNATPWHKFVFDGKIIFMPASTLANNVAWNTLYNAGCVFGTDDTGPSQAATTPVLQNRRVSRDGHVFKLRLPRALLNVDYVLSTTLDPHSEWCALLKMTVRNHGGAASPYKWWSDFLVTYTHIGTNVILMECNSTQSLMTVASGNMDPTGTYNKSGTTTNMGWFPALELIL